MLSLLSIITITYNNQEDFSKTYKSLNIFRDAGGKHIIVNGGKSVNQLVKNDCDLLEEPDEGIYDALNKGIDLVSTPYFMLIHSGDFLVAATDVLEEQVALMEERQLDILLNDCTIEFGKGKRLMSSKNWNPWMFKFGAQPPHPPTIYRNRSVRHYKYNTQHTVIADFDYLERIFNGQPIYYRGHRTLVHMSAGGKTSSGLASFLLVSKEFAKLKGSFVALYFLFTRPLIKIIQMMSQ
jgi:glycosyltransferase involved in cell wall biosynthesis